MTKKHFSITDDDIVQLIRRQRAPAPQENQYERLRLQLKSNAYQLSEFIRVIIKEK